MLYKYQYNTDTVRENLITQNSNLFLIEEQNISEGNFLIFSDVLKVEEQVASLKEQTLDIMQGIADLWTVVDAMKGTV